MSNDSARTALATRKASAEETPALVSALRSNSMVEQFQMAMPRGAEATQLIRDAMTAIKKTPKLLECEQTSVLGGLMTCAQLGLRVGVLGHAWVLPFYNGRSRRHEAQLIIGYQGYRELAQRSGMVSTLIGRAVHKNDLFDVDYGLKDDLVHKPRLDGDRGEIIGYYCIAKYTTGGHAFWHLSKTDAEQHRDRYAMARNKQGEIVGPWKDNFDEMSVKTAFLRLAKWMPKSTDVASAIEADGTVRIDLDRDAITSGYAPGIGSAADEPAPVDETDADQRALLEQLDAERNATT